VERERGAPGWCGSNLGSHGLNCLGQNSGKRERREGRRKEKGVGGENGGGGDKEGESLGIFKCA